MKIVPSSEMKIEKPIMKDFSCQAEMKKQHQIYRQPEVEYSTKIDYELFLKKHL